MNSLLRLLSPLVVLIGILKCGQTYQCPAPNTVTMTVTETLETTATQPLQKASNRDIQITRQINTVLTFDNNGSNFNILTHLLSITGHSAELHRPYPCGLTFFAASDAAISTSVSEIIGSTTVLTEEDVYNHLILILSNRFQNPIFVLSKILLYHMVPHALPFQNLTSSTVVLNTLSDDTVIYNGATSQLHDQNPALQDPLLLPAAELWTMNGVIHHIDRLMFPIPFNPEGTVGPSPSPVPSSEADSGMFVTVENSDTSNGTNSKNTRLK